MSYTIPTFLQTWPGPGDGPEHRKATIAWLQTANLGQQLEGPQREWAAYQPHRHGWQVQHYRDSESPVTVGLLSGPELYDRWDGRGLGWLVVRPSITTVILHRILTETEAPAAGRSQ